MGNSDLNLCSPNSSSTTTTNEPVDNADNKCQALREFVVNQAKKNENETFADPFFLASLFNNNNNIISNNNAKLENKNQQQSNDSLKIDNDEMINEANSYLMKQTAHNLFMLRQSTLFPKHFVASSTELNAASAKQQPSDKATKKK